MGALGPEAGPDHVAALGPVAGPGLRTGPSPVLGPGVVQNQLIERTKKVELTKEGPGLGPRTGPSLETDLNQNLDLALNPGMIKQKKPIRHHKFENFEKRKILTQH